jgi:single-stranded-DNA-specific exonuclease
VAAANAAGLPVLVTDHHLPGAELPAAAAIVNPNQPGCTFPSKALAGVGVIFYVLLALRARLRELGWFTAQRPEPNLAELLDLVALGTVADVVPLDANNRILVHQGLARIRAGRARAGLKAVLEVAGREAQRISSTDLGFILGPRLNAAGRLDDMSLGIRCLISDDVDEARELAAQLSELNRERRSLQADMEREAASIVERLLAQRSGQLPAALVVADPGWHAGVVGLVASRLVEKLHRPTLALAPAAEGSAEWRGSGRSIPGFHLRDALVEVDRREPGLLTRYGGHAMAAGMSLPGSGSERLARSFEVVTEKLLDADARTRTVWTDGGLAADEFTLELAHAIEAAGPFGQGFAEPLFDNEFTVVERRVLKDKHLKLRLQAGSSRRYLDAIWFSAPAPWLQYTPTRLRLLYQLAVERYQGVESLSVRIRHGLTL